MLPATNRGVGDAIATPDVCNTPTGSGDVPTPYVNTAQTSQSTGFSSSVYFAMMNALNVGTTIPTSSGDESGSTHYSIKGKASFTQGDAVVYVSNLPAVRLTSATTQNGSNAVGLVSTPSCSTVFLSYRSAEIQALARYPISCASVLARGSIGYVRARVITSSIARDLDHVVSALARRGARSLVLDLRGVPGGDVAGALRLAERFLPHGSAIARVRGEGGATFTPTARCVDPWSMPLALLVDGETASAAEIVAASLAAHGRAVIAGRRTFGKGAVERVVRWHDGSMSAGTAGVVRGPYGEAIDGAGVRATCSIEAALAALVMKEG